MKTQWTVTALTAYYTADTADKHSTACGNWGQGSFTEPDRPVVFFHLTAYIIVC